MRRIAVAILVVCALGVVPAQCQDPTGVLEGQVMDPGGRAVNAVRVRARNLETGLVRESRSYDAGYFGIAGVPAGHYEVTAAAGQFAPYVRTPATVNVSQTVRLDISLSIAGVQETVTVTGEALLVDSSTNTLGKTVTGREITDLPLNGKNFTQLGLLQAGVAPLTAALPQRVGRCGRARHTR